MELGAIEISGYWIVPIVALSSLLLGWVIEKLILRRLLALLGTKGWQGEDAIRKAAAGFFTFGLFIVGIYASVHYLVDDLQLSGRINLWAKVLFISFLAIYFSRAIGAVIRFYTGHEGAGIPNSSILINLTRFIILIIGFVIILNALDISITPILTALGVGGLAVALALQDTLGNLFAGLQILAARKITTGHIIKLENGEEGVIEDIAWRNTLVKTFRNNMVVIPNSKIANAILTNYSTPSEDFSIAVDGLVDLHSDLDRVHSILLEEANALMSEAEFSFPEYPPSVSFIAFQNSGVSFRIILRVRHYQDQVKLRHTMIMRISRRFQREGIEMGEGKKEIVVQLPPTK